MPMLTLAGMKAMVFAAGLGSRLRPYTNDRPKALVEVAGIPLLEIVLRRLKYFGITEVVINVHHYAEMVTAFLQEKENFGLNIHISDERGLLLETGGGLRKAAQWLAGAPFLVHNVDIMADLPLDQLLDQHQQSKAIATLAVSERTTSRYLRFSENGQLVGWRNAKTGEEKVSRSEKEARDLAFSGIYILDPRIFRFFPPGKQVFSTIEVLLEAARTETIRAYLHDTANWLDVGKPAALEVAPALLAKLSLAQ